MAEGSGSEASVPPGTTALPAPQPVPTTAPTVSYAKIAGVSADNDPAAAVIVVNPETDPAAEKAGENQEEKRQQRGKKGKGGTERAPRKEKGAKKKMQVIDHVTRVFLLPPCFFLDNCERSYLCLLPIHSVCRSFYLGLFEFPFSVNLAYYSLGH